MKKNIIKQISIGALTFLIFLTGCKKALDINVDPNNPPRENGTPQLIFPAGVASAAGRIGSEYAILGGIWAQYWSQSATASQFRYIDSYNITQSDFNGSFDETFAGALNDFDFTIKKSNELGNWKFFLMGTVMKAYTYQNMVDLYDKVPYSEAFQGLANLNPKYDEGYDVYKGLIAEIDAALSKDYNSGPTAGSADVVFDGDIAKWVQFANTLKLKMYLRMVYAKPAEAEAGIRALPQFIIDPKAPSPYLKTDAAFAKFEDNPDKSNPLYEFNFRKLNINTNLRASRTLLTFLQDNADPRIASYYTKTSTETFLGINQGDYTNPDPALANVSVAIVKPTDPVHFISVAESYFLQAEAIERYFGGTGAKAMYDMGVEAAFAQYGYEDQASNFTRDINTNILYDKGGVYLYPSGTFEQKLEVIIVQKWASFPGSHALEGFFEKNRTGYPRSSSIYSADPGYTGGLIVNPKTGTTGGKYPKRLIFPESEAKTNPNTPAVRPLTENVWWDKKI